MKNIQFTLRRTDLKVAGIVVSFALAGWLLATLLANIHPEPLVRIGPVQFFDTIISVPLAILVWCLYHLARLGRYPRRYSRKWLIAEWIVVPLVWLLLMLAFDVWVNHLWQPIESIWEETIKQYLRL